MRQLNAVKKESNGPQNHRVSPVSEKEHAPQGQKTQGFHQPVPDQTVTTPRRRHQSPLALRIRTHQDRNLDLKYQP